jgi:hypothetical protein
MLVTASYLQDTLREAEERLKGIRDESAQLKEYVVSWLSLVWMSRVYSLQSGTQMVR